jgi:hypothetical protein
MTCDRISHTDSYLQPRTARSITAGGASILTLHILMYIILLYRLNMGNILI